MTRFLSLEEFLLAGPDEAVGLAGRRKRQGFGGIAQGAMADAFPVALDAQFLQDGLAFRRLEFLARPMDPDGIHAERMRRQHQVAHHERPVVDVGGPGGLAQHDHHDRRAVERIETFHPAADLAVEFRDAIAQLAVGDDHDLGALTTLAVGGPESGFGYCLEGGFGHRFAFERPAAAARLEGGKNFGFGHGRVPGLVGRVNGSDRTSRPR